MRLAFKILENVYNANAFEEVREHQIQQGNPDTLYFRIVNQEKDEGYTNALRHLPGVSATVTVKGNHIDTNKSFSRTASQPFAADDRSIWSIPILATDRIQFNGLTAVLVDGANTYTLECLTDIQSPVAGGQKFC